MTVEVPTRFTVPLGSVEPAQTRQFHSRSAVTAARETVYVGTADGTVRAVSLGDGEERWRSPGGEDRQVTTIATGEGRVVVGERGDEGLARVLDARTGETRWTYQTAEVVGRADRGDLFSLPQVVDVAVGDERTYLVGRRHGRAGAGWERAWVSAVVAVDGGESVAWHHEASASAVGCSYDAPDERIAVAYDRRPDGGEGLVVHDADTGEVATTWDVEEHGERRIGDVLLDDDRALVACHADKQGHLARIADPGQSDWAVELATPRDVDGETLYASPIHAGGTRDHAIFVTGSTFPVEGRECENLHPFEHHVFGVGAEDINVWTEGVGGYVADLSTGHGAAAAVAGQNFRDPDPDTHAVHLFDLEDGHEGTSAVDGVPTAVTVTEDSVVAVEEPIEYHTDGVERGKYRLHCWSRKSLRDA